MILADKLIKLRKKAGLSQEELADKMDVSRQSVSKWESAQCAPELPKLIQLSNFYGVSLDYMLKDDVTEETPVEISGQEVHDTAFASDRRKYVLYSILRRATACLLFMICAIVILTVKNMGERGLMTMKEFIENWNQLNGYDYVDDFVWQERFDLYIEQAERLMFSENLNTIGGSFFALSFVGLGVLVYNFVRFYNFTGFMHKSEKTVLDDKTNYFFALKMLIVASTVLCAVTVVISVIGVATKLNDFSVLIGALASFVAIALYTFEKSLAGSYSYGGDTLNKSDYIRSEVLADSACLYGGAVALTYLIWCAVDMYSKYVCILWAVASAIFLAAYVVPELLKILSLKKNGGEIKDR